MPLFGEGLELVADQDAIPTFTDKRDTYWDRISAADFLTAEEKRKLLGVV